MEKGTERALVLFIETEVRKVTMKSATSTVSVASILTVVATVAAVPLPLSTPAPMTRGPAGVSVSRAVPWTIVRAVAAVPSGPMMVITGLLLASQHRRLGLSSATRVALTSAEATRQPALLGAATLVVNHHATAVDLHTVGLLISV